MVSAGFDAPDIASQSLQTENVAPQLNLKSAGSRRLDPSTRTQYLISRRICRPSIEGRVW